MRVNVGADRIFKNHKTMRTFFVRTFNTRDVKVVYDTKQRMKRYESDRWPYKSKH